MYLQKDGESPIDYVLVYEKNEEDSELKRRRITTFLNNLRTVHRLRIEKDNRILDEKHYVFVKLHVPLNIIQLYAERLNFKLPIKMVNTSENLY